MGAGARDGDGGGESAQPGADDANAELLRGWWLRLLLVVHIGDSRERERMGLKWESSRIYMLGALRVEEVTVLQG